MGWNIFGFGEKSHKYDTDFCTGILDIIVWINFSDA